MATRKDAEPPPIAIGGVEQPVMQGSQIQALLPQTTSDAMVNFENQRILRPKFEGAKSEISQISNSNLDLSAYTPKSVDSGYDQEPGEPHKVLDGLKSQNLAFSGSMGQEMGLINKQVHTSLYPFSGLFPVDSERFLAQKLIEQQKLATESFLSTNLPDFQSIELTDTPFVQKIFEQTMKMFRANYTDLEGGWQDAVKLAIKYTSQGFANMVESKAIGVNEKVFGVGMNEWNRLKKYSGVKNRA